MLSILNITSCSPHHVSPGRKPRPPTEASGKSRDARYHVGWCGLLHNMEAEMKFLRQIWFRFRAWRLNRWADSLLKDAEYHRRAAKNHSYIAALCWGKASDTRKSALRLIP